jgi:signal transduction histidine kinase/CheY-like chemotaxis protein
MAAHDATEDVVQGRPGQGDAEWLDPGGGEGRQRSRHGGAAIANLEGYSAVPLALATQQRRGPFLEIGPDLDGQHVAADAALQLIGGSLDAQTAGRDDSDPVRENIRFFEVLRGEKDRHAVVAEARHSIPHRLAGNGIETGRRLVEVDHAGSTHQGQRQVEAPAHASRIGLEPLVRSVGEIEFAQQPVGAIPGLMAIAPLRDAGGVVDGSVEVALDISRERALETQLVQAQRLEAVGRLAGGVAHDFNNILTAISGFGELASAELSSDHPVTADIAGDIAQILKASERAAALTQALLAFSRRQVMQTQPINLNEVVNGLTPMLGRLIGEDVLLVVQLDPNLGLISADGAKLEQVVVNLVVNARDAMPAGGTLTIATANADLDASSGRTHVGSLEGPHVALTVEDTGMGMTPDVLEHVFEPFYTTKERGKGTGLGLSTVIGIVQQSGGGVEVESEPNVGTVFTIHLPRINGTPRPAAIQESPGRPLGGKETILVAEDEDAVREFVDRVLRGAGYQVVTAANGAEALAIAESMPHLDLLFTDVVMPGMSGVDLAAQLVTARSGLRVLYASGYTDSALLSAYSGGDDAHLPKPFSAEALLDRVRGALDSRPAPLL